MKKSSVPQKAVRCGEFEVDLQGGCLIKAGVKIRLRQQLFTVLSLLLEHAGEVVTREELKKRLWPGDVVVDFEIDLNAIIARLREVLGDSAGRPRYIETLPKRGYRFLATPLEGAPLEPVPRRRTRLVVLPFLNVGENAAEEYFSDAMTTEIIAALCQVAPDRLAVIARTTAMHYKNSKKDVAHIARELGVDYVVEGGARRSQDRAEMNVQLIQTADQAHVFARKYEAELHNIYSAINQAASDIGARIGVGAAPPERPADLSHSGLVRKERVENPEAYNEYIQARYQIALGSPEGVAKAKRHLERAIAEEPGFALAYDALAELNWLLGYYGYVPPRKAYSAGIVHALRAVEIDDSLAETHALLGEFHKTLEYNWTEVHREMAIALRLDPTSPIVRVRYAVSDLMPHARLEEAIAEIRRALESDPLSTYAQGWLGIMLVLAHRWDDAIDQARLLLRLDPRAFWGHFLKGVAYREKKMHKKAIASLREGLEVSGGMPAFMGWLGLTLGLGGEAAEARSLLDRLRAKAAQGYVPPTSFAWIHLGLAEMEPAFEWLDRAVDECDQYMMPIKSYRFFDPIRHDPRFLDLLRKMNLEP